MERPDGWYRDRATFTRQLWASGRVIHTVTEEAWPDFRRYLETEQGEREGRASGWFAPGWRRD